MEELQLKEAATKCRAAVLRDSTARSLLNSLWPVSSAYYDQSM